MVNGLVIGENQAVAGLWIGENSVNHLQNRWGRAEGERQFHRMPAPFGGTRAGGEVIAHGLKGGWIGALKAVDGLLHIAHREQGPGRAHGAVIAVFIGAVAGEEFVGQGADHLPLFGIGILGFVDQDVIQPTVQFVEHPIRTTARR